MHFLIRQNRIRTGSFFPSALYELIRGAYGVLPLEYLFLSGEKAREQVMFGDPGVFELYGASECPPMLINPLGFLYNGFILNVSVYQSRSVT